MLCVSTTNTDVHCANVCKRKIMTNLSILWFQMRNTTIKKIARTQRCRQSRGRWKLAIKRHQSSSITHLLFESLFSIIFEWQFIFFFFAKFTSIWFRNTNTISSNYIRAYTVVFDDMSHIMRQTIRNWVWIDDTLLRWFIYVCSCTIST